MGILLEKITKPQDMRLLKKELLPELIKEIRQEIISTVSKTGGHLASSLATVELITAIHYVFDAPKDKIIFDVGHQAYAHKLLTGRTSRFHTLRQFGGISGFPLREESEYDCFSTGHSSTAISAALGFAVARDLKKENYKVIAVIGDGTITGGMAFEGLNNAGHLNIDLLVILNDNEMYISHRVGAIAGFLTKLLSFGLVKRAEKRIEKFLRRLQFAGRFLLRVAKRFKLLFFPGMLFEEMGFGYFGPVDGHNFFLLLDILSKLKQLKGPIVLHVVTKKGKGYEPAEKNPIVFHGTPPFEIESGKVSASPEERNLPTYTEVFANTLIELAKTDDKIVAITAAMPQGTGLDKFAEIFPERFFDVGIAEQHAITFAAGLAANGFKPVCAIYSTFLQRAFDQLIHDVALQNLPVVVAIDRAGIVGDDGKTHQGTFDLSYLRLIPNFVVMSPKDENELRHMIFTALQLNRPVAVRYPRSKGIGVKFDSELKILPTAKAEILKDGSDLYILAIGNTVYPALKVSELLENDKISVGVVNMRFLKPLDSELVIEIAKKVKLIVTVEENTICGGLSTAIKEVIDHPIKFLTIALPDAFIEHGSQEILRDKYGLTAEKIYEKIKDFCKNFHLTG